MSCTFWNMRRRMRKQLGIERAAKEETAARDENVINTNFAEPKTEKTTPPKHGRKQVKK